MKPLTIIERVYKYCDLHWNEGKKSIINHFLDENVPRRSIYRYIDLWRKGATPIRRQGSGRNLTIMTKKNLKRLENLIDGQSGISTRQLAKKFDCTHSYIVKTIKKKTNIKYRKKEEIPTRSEQQLAQLQTRCGRMCRKFKGLQFILDDESYFTFSHSNKNSNAGFWSSDIENVPKNVKYKTKAKFEKKLLVWIAISPQGISKPFIAPSGLAVNKETYLKNCIIKRLLPFIEKHHSDSKYVFWPDLALCHYAKSVVQSLKEKNVVFVEKADNPAAVPELRPIEKFWSILKGLVYAKNWKAESTVQLRNRILYCLKKVDVGVVQGMCKVVYSKLDAVRRQGEKALLPPK